MYLVNKIMKQVVTTAKIAVLFGALIASFSTVAFTAEVKTGTTNESAQLQAMNSHQDIVVDALAKENPNLAKDMPEVKKTTATSRAPEWFLYNSGPTNSPSSYSHFTGGTLPCTGNTQLCAIRVTPGTNPMHPDQNALLDIADQIETAVQEGEPVDDLIALKP